MNRKILTTKNSSKRFLQRRDYSLYYEVTGKGPAIIFIHGLGGNFLSWWQQIPYFANHFTCVTFSQRGFFLSTKGVKELDPSTLAADLAFLIESLRLPQVSIIAQSMGGISGLEYTLQNPSRVMGLIMAGSIGSFYDPKLKLLFENIDKKRDALIKRGVHPAAGERMANENPPLHFLYQKIDALNSRNDKKLLRRKIISFQFKKIVPEELSRIATPIFCISGEEDIVTPTQAVKLFASFLPNTKLRIIKKAGHSVYFEKPEIFNRLVGKILLNDFQ
ncbi:MAG: alpha/beta hydrolase [Candidatus Levybacteria bacterium]|nr:alpha/beta hydrolase [Candidatus Levybacteria bacterium]